MIVQPELSKPLGATQAGVFSNLAFFLAGWIACVLGAAAGHPWTGIFLTVLITVAHIVQSARPGQELALAAITAALGMLWNSALLASGLLEFAGGGLNEWIAPAWTLALGMLLATTLNVSLSRLGHHPWLTALIGAILAPLAYIAADWLGALSLPYPEIGIGTIGLGGMATLPLLFHLAKRWNGASLLEA